MFKTLLFVAAAVVLASAADEPEVTAAIVRLEGSGVTGIVNFFREAEGKIRITGTVTGMPAGLYGFHIHETGNLTEGCKSAGPHFNPEGKDHGHPDDKERHVGDLGNIVFDEKKTANVNFMDHEIKLNGRHNIIGRTLILHEGTDDYGKTDHPDSRTTGNAGGRVACGVIGIATESRSGNNAASMSTSNVLIVITFYSLIALLIN